MPSSPPPLKAERKYLHRNLKRFYQIYFIIQAVIHCVSQEITIVLRDIHHLETVTGILCPICGEDKIFFSDGLLDCITVQMDRIISPTFSKTLTGYISQKTGALAFSMAASLPSTTPELAKLLGDAGFATSVVNPRRPNSIDLLQRLEHFASEHATLQTTRPRSVLFSVRRAMGRYFPLYFLLPSCSFVFLLLIPMSLVTWVILSKIPFLESYEGDMSIGIQVTDSL